MLTVRICAILSMTLAGAAFAADTAPATSPAATQAAAMPPAAPAKPITVSANKNAVAPWNGEKIVCTREAPVGSLIAVRHCTTKSEDKANRAAIDEIARSPINNDFSH